MLEKINDVVRWMHRGSLVLACVATDQGDKQKVAKILSEKYGSCDELERLYHIRM